MALGRTLAKESPKDLQRDANGAASVWTRKVCGDCLDALPTLASMGPRLFGRGREDATG